MTNYTFKKTFKFKKKKITIDINSYFFKNKNNIIFFGNPVYKNLDEINHLNINKKIKNINGYFLVLIISKNNILIYNDILGNFRLYFKHCENGNLFISNRYSYFLKKNKIGFINKEEFNFWESKNYTSGDETFFNGLKKIPPSSLVTFNSNGLKLKNIFLNQLKKSNKEHVHLLDFSLKNSLNILKKRNQKIILLFSGGLDSLLLAQKLSEIKANFECVYFYSKIKTLESEQGLIQSIQSAKFLNLSLKIIQIDKKINQKNFNEILECMLFDFHTSFVQFFGIKKIIKEYGKNIQIISGQSADSILCYGPSAVTVSNFLNRLLYLKNNFFTNFFLKTFLQIKYKKKLLLPKNNFEKLYFFYYGFFYYPFFKKENLTIDMSIKKKIKKIIILFKNQSIFTKMYLKIFGFLQGPDNQILIQSCLKNNFSNIFLPFATKEIIMSTCKKQNKLKALFVPKYEVKKLLDKKILKHNLSIKINHIKDKKHKYFIPTIKKLYIKKINEFKK